MANHKSAEKRHRQSLKRRLRNREARASIRTAIKKARSASDAGEKGANELVRSAESSLSKASSKGLLHKKNASRLISRLAKAANRAGKKK